MGSYPGQSGWKAGRYLFVLFYLAAILLLAVLVQWLWNKLLPEILDARVINYWQALGLLLLCRILFGGFHAGAGRGRPMYGRHRFLKEKWMQMSEAERAAFKAEWKKRCEQRGSDNRC
jgi:hypothetical protein